MSFLELAKQVEVHWRVEPLVVVDGWVLVFPKDLFLEAYSQMDPPAKAILDQVRTRRGIATLNRTIRVDTSKSDLPEVLMDPWAWKLGPPTVQSAVTIFEGMVVSTRPRQPSP